MDFFIMQRILIVEDDRINLTFFRDVLRSQGYDTIEASNGVEGVKAAVNERPSLILMDVQLPEMNGTQAVQRLKSNPATQHIPVVALTGYVVPGGRERLLAKGFDDYLSKPIGIDDLLEKVTGWLGQ